MINYESILSAFDGKPTLLQWLKMVKKALDESVLKDVTITKDGDNIAFTFNFEDGTSVTTPNITLPKGITNFETVSNEVVGDETLTTLRVHYSDKTNDEFVVKAKNGKDGIGVLYYHILKISNSTNDKNIYFIAYSTKENLTLEDALSFIPGVISGSIVGYFNNTEKNVVALISKTYGVTGLPNIRIEYNAGSDIFVAEKIVDTKLGENL